MKNKKWIGILITILLLVILTVLCLGFFIKKDNKEEEKEHKIENQTVYMSLGDIIKIEYQKEYDLCQKELCSTIMTKVLSYEVIEGNSEKYQNLDINEKSIEDVLLELYEANKENVEKIRIDTNDKDLNQEKLEFLEENNNFFYQEELNEEEIIKNKIVKEYKILFDSNGGSLIKSETVKEGETVTKPENPTRDGYTFKEWTLNDKTYDFNKEVTENLTLKAVWTKNKTTSESTKPSTSTTPSTPSNTKKESTIDKINLNDYPTVAIDYANYTQPIYYYFITNLKEVFPKLSGKTKITLGFDDATPSEGEYDIKVGEWYAAMDKFQFDLAKEKKVKEEFTNMKNKPGILFESKIGSTLYSNSENHGVSYKYEYITVPKSPLTTLYNGLENVRTSFNKELNNILSGAIVVTFPGYGVYGKYEAGILSEEMCQKYHLVCERW